MNAEVVTINASSGIDLGKVQTQAVEGSQEINKTGRRVVLAYVGAWGFAYDQAVGLYRGGVKLLSNAEKRGESMEAALTKALIRFERQADRRVDAFQDQFSGGAEQVTRNLGEAGETLELRLERQIERVLVNLGIPTRDRLERLNQEIDRLNAKLDEELARQQPAEA